MSWRGAGLCVVAELICILTTLSLDSRLPCRVLLFCFSGSSSDCGAEPQSLSLKCWLCCAKGFSPGVDVAPRPLPLG